MIQQGVRPDEAMSLAKADVNLKARKITIRKSKTNAGLRTLKLTTENWQILARRMLSPGPWIFPSWRRKGQHITKLNGPHDRAVTKLRIPFVLYDLRHTFATRHIEAGTDLPTLKDIMGHEDIRVTQKYVHPGQDHQDKAMERFERSGGRLRRSSRSSKVAARRCKRSGAHEPFVPHIFPTSTEIQGGFQPSGYMDRE